MLYGAWAAFDVEYILEILDKYYHPEARFWRKTRRNINMGKAVGYFILIILVIAVLPVLLSSLIFLFAL